MLYEYASREAAEGSGQTLERLIAEAWPRKGEADEFFAHLRRYINPADNVRQRYTEILTSPATGK